MFVFPVPSEPSYITTGKRPIAVWLIAVINVAIFICTSRDQALFMSRYGFTPASPTFLTLFSSMFIHANWLHVGGNMLFLFLFGRAVEKGIGSLLFVASYAVCGVMATMAQAFLGSAPAIPIVGASGAIAGVVGMFFALFPREPADLTFFLGAWRVRTWHTNGMVATSAWAIEQLILAALASALGSTGGIAFWAHVGGFLAGAAGALALKSSVRRGSDLYIRD